MTEVRERSFGRLKNKWGPTPLRVRRIERVRLHADLAILAVDVCAEPGTGLGGRGVVPRSATLAQGFLVGRLRGDPSAEPQMLVHCALYILQRVRLHLRARTTTDCKRPIQQRRDGHFQAGRNAREAGGPA